MNATFLIVVLSLTAMLVVLVLAIRNKERGEQLRRDANRPGKSAVENP